MENNEPKFSQVQQKYISIKKWNLKLKTNGPLIISDCFCLWLRGELASSDAWEQKFRVENINKGNFLFLLYFVILYG